MKPSNPGLTSTQLLTILNTRLKASHLNFYDEFNRSAEDTDVWTSGGDAGGTFLKEETTVRGTMWEITTGNVINEDWYIHGGDSILNKAFTPYEDGFSTVTWEAIVRVDSAADISSFIGLIQTPITGYAEPAAICAHFLIDQGVSATFRARTYQAAEEETDTLVALDTGYHKFKIVWTAASVLFYIDDILVATHATQVPTYPMVSEILHRTEAAFARVLSVEYVHVELS